MMRPASWVGQSPDDAEPDPVALTQDEVDEFVACPKRIPGVMPSGKPRTMDWRRHSESKLDWDAPLEVDARLVGTLYMFVNPSLGRAWTFKLLFHGEEVFRWDVRPGPVRHKNTNCPRGYPATVRDAEHEHHWIADLDMRCAKPVKNVAGCNHGETLGEILRPHPSEF